MDIHSSARKHGVPDADIRHAIEHYAYTAEVGSDDPQIRVLYLGPDRAGNLLEVVVIELDDGSEQAIHAMKMRGYLRSLLPDQKERS